MHDDAQLMSSRECCKTTPEFRDLDLLLQQQGANNESSKVFDIIKPGRRVKIKGHR